MVTYTYTHPITGCTASQIQYINVEPGYLGINDLAAANAVVMYPNPTSNTLSLTGINTQEIISLKITDIIGQILYTNENLSETMQLDVAGFVPGTYFISFISADGVSVTKRFMKE